MPSERRGLQRGGGCEQLWLMQVAPVAFPQQSSLVSQ